MYIVAFALKVSTTMFSIKSPDNPKRSVQSSTLFRKKRFLLNLKTERNASKFAMFMEKENPRSFFVFHLEQCRHRPGHS